MKLHLNDKEIRKALRDELEFRKQTEKYIQEQREKKALEEYLLVFKNVLREMENK